MPLVDRKMTQQESLSSSKFINHHLRLQQYTNKAKHTAGAKAAELEQQFRAEAALVLCPCLPEMASTGNTLQRQHNSWLPPGREGSASAFGSLQASTTFSPSSWDRPQVAGAAPKPEEGALHTSFPPPPPQSGQWDNKAEPGAPINSFFTYAFCV